MRQAKSSTTCGPIVATVSRRTLATYRDCHREATILVCGCGNSLNTLDIPDSTITVGVNDVGRKLTPNYLVVLNSKAQFKDDRFKLA
jgi:hypothetical protein